MSRKIYPSNYEQDFSGVWDDLMNVFTSSVETFKSWAGDVYKTASLYANEASEWMDKGQAYIQKQYEDVKKQFSEAEQNDLKLQAAISKMPDSQKKKDLQAEFNDANSIFKKYVVPMWNEFGKQTESKMNGMGVFPAVLPVLGYSAAGLLVAVSAYLGHVIVKQQRMLGDPELKKYVAQDVGITGNLARFSENLKWPLMIGGIVAAVYFGSQILDKGNKITSRFK